MFGHGSLPFSARPGALAEPDLCDGARRPGAGVFGAVVGGVAVPVVLAPVDVVDEAAPAMPAAVPPAASAPVTIVAPSSLDMVIASTSLVYFTGCEDQRRSWR